MNFSSINAGLTPSFIDEDLEPSAEHEVSSGCLDSELSLTELSSIRYSIPTNISNDSESQIDADLYPGTPPEEQASANSQHILLPDYESSAKTKFVSYDARDYIPPTYHVSYDTRSLPLHEFSYTTKSNRRSTARADFSGIKKYPNNALTSYNKEDTVTRRYCQLKNTYLQPVNDENTNFKYQSQDDDQNHPNYKAAIRTSMVSTQFEISHHAEPQSELYDYAMSSNDDEETVQLPCVGDSFIRGEFNSTTVPIKVVDSPKTATVLINRETKRQPIQQDPTLELKAVHQEATKKEGPVQIANLGTEILGKSSSKTARDDVVEVGSAKRRKLSNKEVEARTSLQKSVEYTKEIWEDEMTAHEFHDEIVTEDVLFEENHEMEAILQPVDLDLTGISTDLNFDPSGTAVKPIDPSPITSQLFKEIGAQPEPFTVEVSSNKIKPYSEVNLETEYKKNLALAKAKKSKRRPHTPKERTESTCLAIAKVTSKKETDTSAAAAWIQREFITQDLPLNQSFVINKRYSQRNRVKRLKWWASERTIATSEGVIAVQRSNITHVPQCDRGLISAMQGYLPTRRKSLNRRVSTGIKAIKDAPPLINKSSLKISTKTDRVEDKLLSKKAKKQPNKKSANQALKQRNPFLTRECFYSAANKDRKEFTPGVHAVIVAQFDRYTNVNILLDPDTNYIDKTEDTTTMIYVNKGCLEFTVLRDQSKPEEFEKGILSMGNHVLLGPGSRYQIRSLNTARQGQASCRVILVTS